MKGITMCADCAYYNMKTHKCTRGCTGEPDIENGDDVRFFTDCPLPNVKEVRHGRWIDKGEYAVCTECCGRSGTQYDGVEPIPLMTQFCPHCGADMREVMEDAIT